MEKVEVTKCENGYLIELDTTIHVVNGFDSHAALGKIIAETLGVVTIAPLKKVRKKRNSLKTGILLHATEEQKTLNTANVPVWNGQ